jgi:riboflavin biosynthesis pyrimidine reductase
VGINSVMVEGGARIITNFLTRRLVDHVVVTVVPRLIGGLHAVGSLGFIDPAHFPSLHNMGYQRLGEDLVLWGDVAWSPA